MRLLKLKQVLDRVPCSRSKLYDDMARGDFPRPVKLGRLNGWPEVEIDAYIEARIAEREAA